MFEFFRSRAGRQAPKKQPKNRIEKVTLLGREVEVFRKPYRRALSLTVKMNGVLRFTAPVSVTVNDLAKFLSSNLAWVEKTLANYRTLQASYPKKRYENGEEFLVLGKKYALRIRGGAPRPKVFVDEEARELVVETPVENPASSALAITLTKFYEKLGRENIKGRVEELSEKMALRYSKLSFRSQKTRWGSCSSQGALSFNWRLAIAPQEVIDYVVVHELSHLRHYDHSPAFWVLVETQVPEYRRIRGWLKQNQFEADFLGKQSELHT